MAIGIGGVYRVDIGTSDGLVGRKIVRRVGGNIVDREELEIAWAYVAAFD